MNNTKTILVVDDNHGDHSLLCNILKKEKYNTLRADREELALNTLVENSPDLILLDIQMKGKSGLELCKQIKQKENLKEIPLIFLTAATKIEDKLECLKLGAIDYITKPFEKQELLIRIKTHIDLFLLNKTLKKQTQKLIHKNEEYTILNNNYVTLNEKLLKSNTIIKETEKRYRAIFKDNLTVMLVVSPETGRILDANDAAIKYYGYPYEEISQMNINQINILSDNEIKKEMQRAKSGNNNMFYFKHKLSNNEMRDVEVYSSKIVTEKRTVLLSIVHDITDRKKAERLVINNERLLQKITDNYPNSYISIIEKDFTISYLSGQEFKKSNVNPKDYIGLTIEQIYAENTHLVKNEYIKAFNGEECSFEIFFKNQYQHYHLIPLYENNEITRVLSVVENITDRKNEEKELLKAKEEAEGSSKAKSRFLSNMSHELRTPLNSILGYNQLLRDDVNLSGDQKDQIDIVLKSGEHLLNLINDILDISKIEAGKQELIKDDFNLPSLIKDVIDITKVNADKKDLYFYYKTIGEIPEVVHGDKRKTKQILLNVLSNAVKYTKKGGVNFGVELNPRKKNKIIFNIEDSGVGISTEEMKCIFKPFNQLGSKYNTGTGLGLVISKKLIELMKGKLSISSTPSKGSCFTIELPIVTKSKSTHIIENKQILSQTLTEKQQVPIKIPPTNILDKIIKETNKGDYNKLEEIIKKLKKEDKDYRFFTGKLKNLLKEYNEKAIIDYINILKTNIK